MRLSLGKDQLTKSEAADTAPVFNCHITLTQAWSADSMAALLPPQCASCRAGGCCPALTGAGSSKGSAPAAPAMSPSCTAHRGCEGVGRVLNCGSWGAGGGSCGCCGGGGVDSCSCCCCCRCGASGGVDGGDEGCRPSCCCCCCCKLRCALPTLSSEVCCGRLPLCTVWPGLGRLRRSCRGTGKAGWAHGRHSWPSSRFAGGETSNLTRPTVKGTRLFWLHVVCYCHAAVWIVKAPSPATHLGDAAPPPWPLHLPQVAASRQHLVHVARVLSALPRHADVAGVACTGDAGAEQTSP